MLVLDDIARLDQQLIFRCCSQRSVANTTTTPTPVIPPTAASDVRVDAREPIRQHHVQAVDGTYRRRSQPLQGQRTRVVPLTPSSIKRCADQQHIRRRLSVSRGRRPGWRPSLPPLASPKTRVPVTPPLLSLGLPFPFMRLLPSFERLGDLRPTGPGHLGLGHRQSRTATADGQSSSWARALEILGPGDWFPTSVRHAGQADRAEAAMA